MRNPLQEQLLKAGLVNKTKVAKVVRDQVKQREGKKPPSASAEQIQVQQQQMERAERDRALAAERKQQVQTRELRAQVNQIIAAHKLKQEGDSDYRFTDGTLIKSMLVNDALRSQLAKGALVIVRDGDGYALLPRAAADRIIERDSSWIVLDHAHSQVSTETDPDDEYYKQFEVPDDLIW